MNDKTSDNRARTDELPELPDDTIERIETAVFAQIAAERAPVRAAGDRARRRRRRWFTGLGVAAAFVVGVLVTPPILGVMGGGSASSTAESVDMSGGGPADTSAEIAPGAAGAESADSSGQVTTDIDESSREIIATANATLQVDDVQAATAAITQLAEDRGGYVESVEVGRATVSDEASDSMPAAPVDSDYGRITVRIPSDDLPDAITALGESGEVLSSSISRQDVTSVAIDLRARADATRASVERLTALMAQSGSVSELIEAEVALTERQAQLESYEQQLAALEDQVAMSTLQVDLTRSAAPTAADPAGFSDGLLAGWNGLVVSLNALVIALGFVLPWLVIAGAVALVIWLVRRARRARRAVPRHSDAEAG
ncbi:MULTISPECIES: DUF4349 domain-containing protein [unclassified Microbacterium]|uniref:DUF4349 domain-containing protein n=1 Tax=unclassified Microbacterium TaxID=2609290 RepID=UPI000EA895A8|nr:MULTISPECIES: DUF4349 domain-containing protein [unclassified Microbacterium]MBT2485668.1 DUF4349 domain-containing protein [Microbacterium sp. ISL-108]RKN68444.1 DUF4349 domain-containing protein [Microbacterium sp. CGR2]